MNCRYWRLKFLIIVSILVMAGTAYSAYHHGSDTDSDVFKAVYPETAGSKLDHCAVCHTGGEYIKWSGKSVSLGSCQWCHYSFGYDGSGDIDSTLNGYGRDYRDNGKDQDALAKIAEFDSDGDGFINKEEIEAVRYPGDDEDDPTKVEAPYRVYTMEELKKLTPHTQFMLMNTHKSGDFYAEYSGITIETLLINSGILPSATGIAAHAPDGFSQYYPLEEDSDPLMYSVLEEYPPSVYYYDPQADEVTNEDGDGWCDYSAPDCSNYLHNDPIDNSNGNKLIIAFERNGNYLEHGVLNIDNKLDGEGPFRIVPPQKNIGPPDQSVKSEIQDVIWPFSEGADHNAGFAIRSATIIKVEPLPEGTTDIDLLEAGWDYVDQGKIVVYGAIDPVLTVQNKLVELKALVKSIDRQFFKRPGMKSAILVKCRVLNRLLDKGRITPVKRQVENWFIKRVDGCINYGIDENDWIMDCEAQKQVYWKLNEILVLLNIVL